MNKEPNNMKFEDHIKNTLEDYQLEYNPAHWNELEHKLSQGPSNHKNRISRNRISIAGGIIASGIVTFFIFNSIKDKEVIKEENLIPKKEEIITANPESIDRNKIIKESNTFVEEEKSENLNSDITEIPSVTINSIPFSAEQSEEKTFPSSEKSSKLYSEEKPNDPKTIIINSSKFNFEKTPECNYSYQFFPEKIDETLLYTWNFGDGNYSTKPTPLHIYNKAGVFTIELTVSTKENQESTSSKKEIVVQEIIKTKSEFDWRPFTSNSISTGAEFINQSNGATEWFWHFGDNQFSNEKDPKHIYLSKGSYHVTLLSKNLSGCSDTLNRIIQIESLNPLLAPSAFSPDGDGLNDFFIPKKLEIADEPFEMFIYDRAGILVYQTNDAGTPWNGRHMNSGELYSGGSNFVWQVNIKHNNGEEKIYLGNVVLLR